jgi:predicted GIY-YIG superfamily endonuclease
MKEHNYSVYMVASKSRALYIGMTNNLHRRIFEHKNDLMRNPTWDDLAGEWYLRHQFEPEKKPA